MSATAMLSVNPSARRRSWWAALAIVALALLSLRPACEAWLSHWAMGNEGHHAAAVHGHVHSAPAHASHEDLCCGSLEAFALARRWAFCMPTAEASTAVTL